MVKPEHTRFPAQEPPGRSEERGRPGPTTTEHHRRGLSGAQASTTRHLAQRQAVLRRAANQREMARREAARREAARQRMLRRRRRTTALLVVLVAAVLILVDLKRDGAWYSRIGAAGRHVERPAVDAPAESAVEPQRREKASGPGDPATAGKGRVPAAGPGPDPGRARASQGGGERAESGQNRAARVPAAGPGTFSYANGTGVVLGSAGPLRRFRVAVENGTGQNAAAFASAVERVLGDRRSWIASGQLRLRRVSGGASAEFTIFLATPTTSERMCAKGGLSTERYTSCRLPGEVIINLARWWRAVPGYGAARSEYQAYAINHEVGHELGFGHETCPGRGRLAPVMQQQTLAMRGCRANGWPYLNGRRYAGASVP